MSQSVEAVVARMQWQHKLDHDAVLQSIRAENQRVLNQKLEELLTYVTLSPSKPSSSAQLADANTVKDAQAAAGHAPAAATAPAAPAGASKAGWPAPNSIPASQPVATPTPWRPIHRALSLPPDSGSASTTRKDRTPSPQFFTSATVSVASGDVGTSSAVLAREGSRGGASPANPYALPGPDDAMPRQLPPFVSVHDQPEEAQASILLGGLRATPNHNSSLTTIHAHAESPPPYMSSTSPYLLVPPPSAAQLTLSRSGSTLGAPSGTEHATPVSQSQGMASRPKSTNPAHDRAKSKSLSDDGAVSQGRPVSVVPASSQPMTTRLVPENPRSPLETQWSMPAVLLPVGGGLPTTPPSATGARRVLSGSSPTESSSLEHQSFVQQVIRSASPRVVKSLGTQKRSSMSDSTDALAASKSALIQRFRELYGDPKPRISRSRPSSPVSITPVSDPLPWSGMQRRVGDATDLQCRGERMPAEPSMQRRTVTGWGRYLTDPVGDVDRVAGNPAWNAMRGILGQESEVVDGGLGRISLARPLAVRSDGSVFVDSRRVQKPLQQHPKSLLTETTAEAPAQCAATNDVPSVDRGEPRNNFFYFVGERKVPRGGTLQAENSPVCMSLPPPLTVHAVQQRQSLDGTAADAHPLGIKSEVAPYSSEHSEVAISCKAVPLRSDGADAAQIGVLPPTSSLLLPRVPSHPLAAHECQFLLANTTLTDFVTVLSSPTAGSTSATTTPVSNQKGDQWHFETVAAADHHAATQSANYKMQQRKISLMAKMNALYSRE